MLARADERGLPLRRVETDLDDLASAESARLKETTLRIVSDLSAVKAGVDPDGFVRVLRNLADNAARYATSEVTIVVRAKGDNAVVQVIDDGPGIPCRSGQGVRTVRPLWTLTDRGVGVGPDWGWRSSLRSWPPTVVRSASLTAKLAPELL